MSSPYAQAIPDNVLERNNAVNLDATTYAVHEPPLHYPIATAIATHFGEVLQSATMYEEAHDPKPSQWEFRPGCHSVNASGQIQSRARYSVNH